MNLSRVFPGVVLAAGLLAGCQTASEVNQSYEEYSKNRPATVTIVSGDKAIDAVAATSAQIHREASQMLDDYVAVSNVRYRHFCAALEQKMQEQNISEAEAYNSLKAEYMKTPEGKAEWAEVEKGLNAVQAQDPAGKLARITPLLASAISLSQNAGRLGSSFNRFDASTLTKLNAVIKVTNQTAESVEALNFLQRFYSINQAIPR